MLDFLFRRKKETQPKEQPQSLDALDEEFSRPSHFYYTPGCAVTRRLDDGMPIEVLDDEFSVIFRGRIVDENALCIMVGRLPGELALQELEKGTGVTMLAYNTEMEHVRIHATIVDSTAMRLVVRDWDLEDTHSKRDAKRFPIDITGKLFKMDDTRLLHPTVCAVKDLSESGAHIVTETELHVGDNLRLQIEVLKGDGLISMPSRVVWASGLVEGHQNCGLLFAELERRKVRDLRLSLKALQEQIVKETKK